MSRKFLSILIVATVVAVGIIAAPFIQGFRTETRLKSAIVEANRSLTPIVSIEIVKYRRGWFDAEIEGTVSLRLANATERFAASLKVIHGPWPLLEIIRGNESLKIVDALIGGQLRPSPSSKKQASSSTRTSASAPIAFQALIGHGARARAKFILKAFDNPDGAFGWQAGSVILSTSNDFQRPTAEIKIRGLSYRDPGREQDLAMNSVRLTYKHDSVATRAVVELKLDSLRARLGNWRAELTETSGYLAPKTAANSVTATSGSLTFKRVQFHYRDYVGVSWECDLSGVTATSEVTLEKGKASVSNRYRVRNVTTSHSAYGPIDGVFNATATGSGAPVDLAQSWELFFASEDSPSATVSSTNQPNAAVLPLQVQSDASVKLKHTGRLSQLTTQSVKYLTKGPQGYADFTEENLKRGALNLDLDDAFLNAFVYEVTDLTVQRSVYFQEDAQVDKSEGVKTLLSELEKDRLLKKLPGRYQSSITWRQGVIRAYQKPLSVWTLVKLLAMRKMVITPGLSLRIESIESRGALSQTQVTSAIKPAGKKLADCVWRGRVKSKTPLHEQVKVTWEVDKKGKARITNIAFIAKENASIRSCLQNVIQSDTSYPRSSEATSASLTIRYELAAAGQGSSDSAGR